jgi:glycosyltransferase involved in cell wall biosynthesis
MMASRGKSRRVLIIVENLPSPFDRRVWQEATTLHANGYEVAIICPKGKGFEASYEHLEGVHIYRHWLPTEANNALGYLFEYSVALSLEFYLALKIAFKHGFDAIHACNPPDNIFIVAAFFKMFGKRFLFDHHDISPELYEAKFSRRDIFYKIMLLWEKLTFRLADVSIATNESYKEISISRGKMPGDKVFVVRSGPDLNRLKIQPPVATYKNGRRYLVGYVGVMGTQEGLDHLLRIVRIITVERERSDIQFCLVGGGTELSALKQYAEDLDVADFVTFTGRVDDATLLDVLNTAEVCVNPDVPSEMNNKSTMNKIMEYMSLGKPIVQYDLDEGRRSALDASLYAEPNNENDFADKILKLIDDPVLCKNMGSYGRDRVQSTLEWQHEIPKLLAAYDALFSR